MRNSLTERSCRRCWLSPTRDCGDEATTAGIAPLASRPLRPYPNSTIVAPVTLAESIPEEAAMLPNEGCGNSTSSRRGIQRTIRNVEIDSSACNLQG